MAERHKDHHVPHKMDLKEINIKKYSVGVMLGMLFDTTFLLCHDSVLFLFVVLVVVVEGLRVFY